MRKKESSLCFNLNCDEDQFPFWYCLFTFSIGLLLGWFVFDYLVNIFNLGELCWLGYRFHNLYFGALIVLFCAIFIAISHSNVEYIVVCFVLGLGFGLTMNDLLIHFVYKTVSFSLYCV